jgi:hypothetical protein
MKLNQLINRLADDGIKSVVEAYPNREDKRLGSIDGFNACRGKTIEELRDLLAEAKKKSKQHRSLAEYWRHRYFEIQVEFVCNCVSVVLLHEGKQNQIIVEPTLRGTVRIREILGIIPIF